MSALAARIFTRTALARLAVIAVMLAIWEIAARGFVDPLFLAPPSKVVAGLGTVFATKGVPWAVITMIGVSGASSRHLGRASRPSMSGSFTSRRMRS